MVIRMVKHELVVSGSSRGVDETNERDLARALRSRYYTDKTVLFDEREELTKPDLDKFNSIIKEVESLYQLITTPREHVTDAEAFLGIVRTLLASIRAYDNEGITASGFVDCILCDFGQQSRWSSSVSWKNIGHAVSHIFQRGLKCYTMIGPMSVEVKRRKAYQCQKHRNHAENDTPELGDAVEDQTETVKNVACMFSILKAKRRVRLENLVLNANTFAQTVESVFALSFLAKDGQVEIKVNDQGHHLVSPRNDPASEAIASGEASYCHLVFRFDLKDWKLMKEAVRTREELMPHRFPADLLNSASQSEELQTTIDTTPIWKFSRNRGFVIQDKFVETDSSQMITDDSTICDNAAIRKGKPKMI